MRGARWGLLLGLCTCGKPPASAHAPSLAPHSVSHVGPSASPQCAPPNPHSTDPGHPAVSADPAKLPFGFYSLPVGRFAEVARAGVTMVGPYYGDQTDATLLDAATAEGLQVIAAVGVETARLDEGGLRQLGEQIDAVADHEAVAAWYVLPEELRPWSAREMDYAASLRAAVKTRDSLARPLLSYQPNHRRREELTQASASMDVVTRGLYANFVGASTRRGWVRVGLQTITAATGEAQTPWAVLEMFAQPAKADADASRIRAAVRHDVYASVIEGARGVLVFSGWPRANFPAYADYFAAYLEVAGELNGALGLATPLLRGEAVAGPTDANDAIDVETVSGPALVDASMSAIPHMLPSVATRQLRYDGALWLYAVNSAESAVTLRVSASCIVRTVLGPPVAEQQVQLPPLGVVVLRAPGIWLTDDLHTEPAEGASSAPMRVGAANHQVP